jgi:DNA ligase-1
LKRPLATLDVVVTAVEYGHGKRRGLLSDYTFAVRNVDRLVDIQQSYCLFLRIPPPHVASIT